MIDIWYRCVCVYKILRWWQSLIEKKKQSKSKIETNKNNQDVINIFLTIFCNLNTPTSITDGESIINDNRLSIDDNAHTYSGNHYREMIKMMEFRIIESCKKNCLKKIAKSAKNIEKLVYVWEEKSQISTANKQTQNSREWQSRKKTESDSIRIQNLCINTHTHRHTLDKKPSTGSSYLNFEKFSKKFFWKLKCMTMKLLWNSKDMTKKTKKITPTFFNGSRHHRHRILFKRIQIHQKWLNQVFSLSIIDDCRCLCSELFVEFVFR